MIIPYLTFQGNCAQALTFYADVFGCEHPAAHLYADYVPEGLQNPPAGLSGWVLHAEMEIGESKFWFADETEPLVVGNNVKLTLPVATAAEAGRIYDALSADGRVVLPPTETGYSTFHASVVDRFGICWNIVAQESPAQIGASAVTPEAK